MEMCGKAYDIFLFDLDGTIVDSSAGITDSVMYALKRYGIVEQDRTKLYSFIGPPLTESFGRYYGFSPEKAREAVGAYREYYREKGIYDMEVYEGFEDTLKKLKESGKRLLVATSKPEVFARKILDYCGLAQYFDYIAGAKLDDSRKAKADVIAYALASCRIQDTLKTVMVGDREHDVIGAKKNGLDCIGVLYGFGSREELHEAGADHIVSRPEDILKYAHRAAVRTE